MAMVNLPEELARRLEAEAARRGVSPDEFAAEALQRVLGDREQTPTQERADAIEAFIGCGDSGDPDWAGRDIHDLRAEAAARKLARGA
jgi:plasmid stability protein